MSIIFSFKEMDKAEAFVAAVKERYGLGGQTFEDEDAAQAHDPFPWRQEPPIAHIDRVDAPEDGLEAVKNRFGVTLEMMAALRSEEDYVFGEDTYTVVAAERQVEALAVEFGGQYLGT